MSNLFHLHSPLHYYKSNLQYCLQNRLQQDFGGYNLIFALPWQMNQVKSGDYVVAKIGIVN